MSKKFFKDREVPFYYHAVPIKYTGIKHPNRHDTELVLLDGYKNAYLAAYRNNDTNKVGRHFLLKREVRSGKLGFVFKDKFYAHCNSGIGWVW